MKWKEGKMGTRYYTFNGKKLPSVTTITGQLDKSGALTYWAAGCAADYILEHIELVKLQDDSYEEASNESK